LVASQQFQITKFELPVNNPKPHIKNPELAGSLSPNDRFFLPADPLLEDQLPRWLNVHRQI
jgi:hypothetical protein